MSCTGRYADSWQFSAFWCTGSIITGLDDSGGAVNAALQDTQVNFIALGVRPNVGMILFNLTQDTSGPVTAVTDTALTATGVTWDDANIYRIVPIDKLEIARIEHFLDIAAADIHAAMAASGACDCTLADWAGRDGGYLEKLNIIEAGSLFTCSCISPDLSAEERATFFEWVNNQLVSIRNGTIELCHGETGSEFPAFGWAAQSVTEFATRDIILNSIARNS